MSFPVRPVRVRRSPRVIGARSMPRLIEERVGQPLARRTLSQEGNGLRPAGQPIARTRRNSDR